MFWVRSSICLYTRDLAQLQHNTVATFADDHSSRHKVNINNLQNCTKKLKIKFNDPNKREHVSLTMKGHIVPYKYLYANTEVSDNSWCPPGIPSSQLLFLLYINDLPRYNKNDITLFADNSTLKHWSKHRHIRILEYKGTLNRTRGT